ncbi:MAG: DUF2752 domain-containing protein [Sphingobacteriaceae bacterium]|nr:DUF2752 domain-containing protein [Sphingobacteriaceae bacterium]
MIEFIENNLLACSFKAVLGVECPGCGMQRAFIALIKGDFFLSLQLNPSLLPFIFTLVYCLLHIRMNFQNGARNIVILFSSTVLVMTLNFVIKLI